MPVIKRVQPDTELPKQAAVCVIGGGLALYQAYGPSWISTIYAPSAQYKVLLELLPKYQQHADSLSLLYMKGDEGNLVPLSSITRVTRDAGPLTINHSGQLPSVRVMPGSARALAAAASIWPSVTRRTCMKKAPLMSSAHSASPASSRPVAFLSIGRFVIRLLPPPRRAGEGWRRPILPRPCRHQEGFGADVPSAAGLAACVVL